MRHLILPCLSICLLLVSCTKEKQIESLIYEYEDVKHLSLEWNNLFIVEDDDYYTYIYSETCGHCRDIKQEVITKSLETEKIYFVLFNKEIPIISDKEVVIGKNDFESLGIIGTPTLFRIQNHMISEHHVGSHDILETLTNLSKQ